MAVTKKVIRGLKRLRFTIGELATDMLVLPGAVATKFNAFRTYLGDGILQIGTVTIDAAPEKFKTTTILVWRRLGIQFTKAATTAIVFSSGYTINTAAAAGIKWGAFLIQITDLGVISTKAVGANQSYASEPLAVAALPAPDAGNTYFAHATVAAKTGAAWTANTDDMTAASDCSEAHFYNVAVLSLPAALA